jgi:DNA-directed RNA polymerase subunit RPC12/RpoP
MESLERDFFCHTCKKLFKKALASEDDEVLCAHCQDCFVEMIEDQTHMQQLKDIYKEEIKRGGDQ